MSLWLLEGSGKGVLETGLGGSDMVLSIGNIDILSAEVWHEIILGVTFRVLERCLHLVAQSLLGLPFVGLGIADINVLWTEIWYKVVNWMSLWLLK